MKKLLLFTTILFISSCSKRDTPPPATQKPITNPEIPAAPVVATPSTPVYSFDTDQNSSLMLQDDESLEVMTPKKESLK